MRNVEIGKHLELDHLVGDVEERLGIHDEAVVDLFTLPLQNTKIMA
jgi:hypothetical protein